MIIAAVTSTRAHRELPAKVVVAKDSPEGQGAGLRLDSVIDCQTLVTIPRDAIVTRLGRFASDTMGQVDRALASALGL